MPGRRYSIDGEQNIASPDDSVLTLTGASTIRCEVYYFAIGNEGTPADNQHIWYIQRHTAEGTNTTVTPQALDPGDPASLADGGENHTVEPTYTSAAIFFRLGLNARAAHAWYADPFGGIKMPASTNGLGWYPQHASSTVLVSVVAHFCE